LFISLGFFCESGRQYAQRQAGAQPLLAGHLSGAGVQPLPVGFNDTGPASAAGAL
jgi:hypothetical protein